MTQVRQINAGRTVNKFEIKLTFFGPAKTEIILKDIQTEIPAVL